ncbi:MAG: P-loop NTPase family protein, partial [Candidatus Helarchaeales archaeon]
MAKYKLKCVALGGFEPDRSKIIRTVSRGSFGRNYKTTIGCDIFTKRLILNDGQDEITLSIWDIAGEDRFSFFRPQFYRGASGAIVFFNMKKYSSFNPCVVEWIRELWTHVGRVPVILYGYNSQNPDFISVREDEIDNFCQAVPCRYFLDSSKTSIEDAIQQVANQMLDYLRNNPMYHAYIRAEKNWKPSK